MGAFGLFRFDIFKGSCVDPGGVLWPLRPLLLLRRFDVSRAAQSPGPDPRLPTPRSPRPGSTRSTTIYDALPDPDPLCAEERAAAMRHAARLRNRIEDVSDRSGRCRGYCRGFPGSGRRHHRVPGGDRHRVAGGGGVGDGEHRTPCDLPVVKDALGCRSISGLHVYQILAHAPAIDDFTSRGRDRRPGEE